MTRDKGQQYEVESRALILELNQTGEYQLSERWIRDADSRKLEKAVAIMIFDDCARLLSRIQGSFSLFANCSPHVAPTAFPQLLEQVDRNVPASLDNSRRTANGFVTTWS